MTKISRDELMFILLKLGNDKFIEILTALKFTDSIMKKIAELEESTKHAIDLDFVLDNTTAQQVNLLQFLRVKLEEATPKIEEVKKP